MTSKVIIIKVNKLNTHDNLGLDGHVTNLCIVNVF